MNDAFRRRLPLFLDRWAPHFDAGLGPQLTRLANHLDTVVRGFYDRPLTLAHGDFRTDNLLFRGTRGDEAVVVVDWQFCQQLPGTTDLHYFLATNFGQDLTGDEENRFLELYYDELRSGGVQDYSLAQFRDDYARAGIWVAIFGVVGMAPVDPSVDDRNRELVQTVHKRLLDSFITSGAERFIPK